MAEESTEDRVTDGEILNHIGMDALRKISPEKSELTYTPDMLAYRKQFEAWAKTLPKGAVIDFPT